MAEASSRILVEEISKQSFRPIPLVHPPVPVMSAFTTSVEPLYDRITTNLRQSKTLAALCDFLLPKLLSGKVRVREAERIAERV